MNPTLQSVTLAPASRPEEHVVATSSFDLEATVARLASAIAAEDLLLIHAIDPRRLLAGGGYSIPPMRQLLFFHPRYMARLLRVDPAAVVEVPLKVFVFEAGDGTVTARFVDPRRTLGRYPGLAELASELAAVCARVPAAVS